MRGLPKAALHIPRGDQVGQIEQLGIVALDHGEFRRRVRRHQRPVLFRGRAPALHSNPDKTDGNASLVHPRVNPLPKIERP